MEFQTSLHNLRSRICNIYTYREYLRVEENLAGFFHFSLQNYVNHVVFDISWIY